MNHDNLDLTFTLTYLLTYMPLSKHKSQVLLLPLLLLLLLPILLQLQLREGLIIRGSCFDVITSIVTRRRRASTSRCTTPASAFPTSLFSSDCESGTGLTEALDGREPAARWRSSMALREVERSSRLVDRFRGSRRSALIRGVRSLRHAITRKTYLWRTATVWDMIQWLHQAGGGAANKIEDSWQPYHRCHGSSYLERPSAKCYQCVIFKKHLETYLFNQCKTVNLSLSWVPVAVLTAR